MYTYVGFPPTRERSPHPLSLTDIKNGKVGAVIQQVQPPSLSGFPYIDVPSTNHFLPSSSFYCIWQERNSSSTRRRTSSYPPEDWTLPPLYHHHHHYILERQKEGKADSHKHTHTIAASRGVDIVLIVKPSSRCVCRTLNNGGPSWENSRALSVADGALQLIHISFSLSLSLLYTRLLYTIRYTCVCFFPYPVRREQTQNLLEEEEKKREKEFCLHTDRSSSSVVAPASN